MSSTFATLDLGHAPVAPSNRRADVVDDAVWPAVRDAAARATVAVGLGAVIVIHAVDAVGKWTEARYLFWLYMAAIVGAAAVAGAVLFTRARATLLAAAGVAGGIFVGYVVNRTVGLPNAMDDVGNWTEPLGLASLVVEAATVAVAVAAYATSRPGAAGRAPAGPAAGSVPGV